MGVAFELALMFGAIVAVVVAVSSFRRFKMYRVDTMGRPYDNALALALRAGVVIGGTAMLLSWVVLALLL